MVEAWFTVNSSPEDPEKKIPVLFPTDEIVEFMSAIGYTMDDAFSVEIPGGFSRPARIRCLVSQAGAEDLMLSFIDEANSRSSDVCTGTFTWKDGTMYVGTNVPMESMIHVLIRPPRPVVLRDMGAYPDGGEGLFLIEAYDLRYALCRSALKMQQPWTVPVTDQIGRQDQCITTDLFSADGRRMHFSREPLYNYLWDWMDKFKSYVQNRWGNLTISIPVDMENDSDLTGPLRSRIANLTLHPDCSMALAADILLSMSGYVATWVGRPYAQTPKTEYRIRKIGTDYEPNYDPYWGQRLAAGKRMTAGGLDAKTWNDSSDPLVRISENIYSTSSPPRCGRKVSVLHPYRQVEGKTLYSTYQPGAYMEDDGWKGYVNWELSRERPTQENLELSSSPEQAFAIFESVLREPRAYVASRDAAQAWKDSWPTALPEQIFIRRTDTSLPFPQRDYWAWDDAVTISPGVGTVTYSEYAEAVKENLWNRHNALFNRTVFAGWLAYPYDGQFADRGGLPPSTMAATMLKYFIARWRGTIKPLTRTVCEWDDWILGPTGDLTNDPKEVLMSRGMVHARRVGVGMMSIEVPPPMTRVFPARIVSAVRVSDTGNDYWKWKYQWIEVEPEPIKTAATPYDNGLDGYERRSDTTVVRKNGTTTTYDNYARNLSENGNVYLGAGNAGNVIQPGVLQSDYPDSTIECDPVREGTIVTMVEQSLQKGEEKLSPSQGYVYFESAPQFWFTVPNPFRVVCL